MPARYQSEVSNLLVHRVLFEFPLKLLTTFLSRLVLKNFIYDFSMASIYLLTGLPLLLFGLISAPTSGSNMQVLASPRRPER